MSSETAYPNWIDRPILFRLYDLVNDVPRPPEEVKQTLIDAANEISDLVNEAKLIEDDDCECQHCGTKIEEGSYCAECDVDLEADYDEDDDDE